MNKIQEIKFNNQKIQFNYRGDDDMSVIEEFFVDKMYRATEDIITKTNNPILDIGAHIGCFSIYARKLNSHSPIIAIEPEPDNFSLLKENLKLNHCGNVTVKQMALINNTQTPIVIPAKAGIQDQTKDSRLRGNDVEENDHNNKTILYLNEDSHNHSTFYKTDKSITVSAITLEDLIKNPAVAKAMAGKFKLNKIGILKIDIEGEEFSVIKNLKSETWNLIENIILEYHDFRGNNHNDLVNIIHSHGFSIEHFPNHYDKRFGLLICRNKVVHNS